MTNDQLESIRVARLQLLDLGDESTAATLAWALKDEQHEKEMLAVIDERDEREEVINAILDEVLGLDRHEWSSAYGFADAVEDVKTRMHAIEREHSGLESEIEDLRAESWPDWANQVLKIVRAQSGYDGYDDADGVDIPGEVQELADEYSRTFEAMETYRKERDEARSARSPAPEDGKDAARDKLALAVISAARSAMDQSFEAGNREMDIAIPSHFAATLSLCLDEYDAAMAQGERNA